MSFYAIVDREQHHSPLPQHWRSAMTYRELITTLLLIDKQSLILDCEVLVMDTETDNQTMSLRLGDDPTKETYGYLIY